VALERVRTGWEQQQDLELEKAWLIKHELEMESRPRGPARRNVEWI